MSRIPAVARALAARLGEPHSCRTRSGSPAVLPDGDGLASVRAVRAAAGRATSRSASGRRSFRRIARGTGRRGAIWFHCSASPIGSTPWSRRPHGYNVVHATPPSRCARALPIVLIPTAGVPQLLACHRLLLVGHLVATSRAPRQSATQAAPALG